MRDLTLKNLIDLRKKHSNLEIAKMYGVSESTICRYIKIAKLPAKRPGKNKINFIGEK